MKDKIKRNKIRKDKKKKKGEHGVAKALARGSDDAK
jgi:hypothetical protein